MTSEAPDVRSEPPMRPTPAVVIAAAVVLGVLWQMLFVAFPDWRVLSDAACIFVAVLLNKWAHS